jgi:hypothetical protein
MPLARRKAAVRRKASSRREKEITAVRCALHQDRAGTLAKLGASEDLVASSTSAANAARIAKAVQNFSSVWEQPSKVEKAKPSRYSDGSYNVLYTATHDETAKAERLHWAAEYVFKPKLGERIFGFFLYTCRVKGKCLDYTKGWKRRRKEMVHPTDYSYCHGIARKAVSDGIDYLIVPSARKLGGYCVPIFNKKACKIVAEQKLFDVYWDAKKSMPYTEEGKVNRYVKIDIVYDLV